ncbi:MAG: argininosuccinate lyase [Deltaproteobacteria bacterium]|nr:argininosuccinate lyase [Deltaproteobacteria bacterium]
MTEIKKQIWGSHLSQSPDEAMVRFCAGRDVSPLKMADEELLIFDLWTNRAHVIMLFEQGIIQKKVALDILEGLLELESEWKNGRFELDPQKEDVHVNVEHFVSTRKGEETGGRIHTARSRNDQVATDMRLFMRQAVLSLSGGVVGLAGEVARLAEAHLQTLMPGFTHTQPAMITTWGHWLAGYGQALLRDLERLKALYARLNRSPLGAAASFGTSWPINRERTADLLAFDRVDENTLDCVSSRWEMEFELAAAIGVLMNHLAVMAQDLVLLSHPYWGMIRLADGYVTGSSIMPQKRNPDFAEVIRGKSAWVGGQAAGLLAVAKGGMSGYNRDTQITKPMVLDLVRECVDAPLVMKDALATARVHGEKMEERLKEGFLAAADFADSLARAGGISFRRAYHLAAVAVRYSGDAGVITSQAARRAVEEGGIPADQVEQVLAELDHPAKVLEWRQHTGSPAPLQVKKHLAGLTKELDEQNKWLREQEANLEQKWNACRDYTP